MSAIIECFTGCTIRGQHQSDCAGTCRHEPHEPNAKPHPRCEGTCRGCLPRPADEGVLCQWCWTSLNGAVVDAPQLARHLYDEAEPGAAAKPADADSHRGDPATRTIRPAALDAADELHARLAAWGRCIIEEHPDGEHMAGPDERGTTRTRTVAVVDSDIAREDHPYMRWSEVAGLTDPEATSRLVRWLLPLLPWCARQEWAAEMRRDVLDVVRTTQARWPIAERTRPIPSLTCPDCARVSLVYDPPTVERGVAQVSCSSRGCGRVYTEEEFARVVRQVEYEQAHGERIGA